MVLALQSFCISLLSAWHKGENLFVGWDVASHIEGRVEVKLEECFKLAYVVGKLRLAVDNGILSTAQLCLELHDIRLCHLSLIHHLHASVVLAFSGSEEQFVDPLGFFPSRMLCLEPCPIAIMMMTAAAPMMMPSMLRKERNLLLMMAVMATFNRLVMLISCVVMFCLTCLVRCSFM